MAGKSKAKTGRGEKITASDIKLLKQSALFKGFANADLKQILSVAREKKFGTGNTIFYEGDKGKSLFFIKSGTVSVVKADDEGVEQTISFLYEGEPFGEMALIDGGARSARIIATTPVLLLEIKRASLNRLFKHQPELEMKFMKAFNLFLVRRLREASENLVEETIYMG